MMLAFLAGCAAPSETEADRADAEAAPAGPERGIVTGTRPLPAGPVPPARAQMVAQVIRVSAGGTGGFGGAQSEVIVRLERGRDVALIQPEAAGLRIGQRVTLLPGERPRLVPDGT